MVEKMKSVTSSNMLNSLEEWKKTAGVNPLLVDFYQSLLQIQTVAEARAVAAQPDLSAQAAGDRLGRGLPLMAFDDLKLDWTLVREVFIEVGATFAHYPGLFGKMPDSFKEWDSSLIKEAVRSWFTGVRLPDILLATGCNEHLLQYMIQAAVKPFLASYSRALLPKVQQEHWRQGYCPVCGGSPDFAYLEKEQGARWLLCSRCDTEWLFQRLECPFCETQNQSALGYFTDDEGFYRLYTCDHCKRYLKAVDLRRAKSDAFLPLERLFTIGMDVQAQEHGYKHLGFSV